MALRHLEDEEFKSALGLVIFDQGILRYETDRVYDARAGDILYRDLSKFLDKHFITCLAYGGALMKAFGGSLEETCI